MPCKMCECNVVCRARQPDVGPMKEFLREALTEMPQGREGFSDRKIGRKPAL